MPLDPVGEFVLNIDPFSADIRPVLCVWGACGAPWGEEDGIVVKDGGRDID